MHIVLMASLCKCGNCVKCQIPCTTSYLKLTAIQDVVSNRVTQQLEIPNNLERSSLPSVARIGLVHQLILHGNGMRKSFIQ